MRHLTLFLLAITALSICVLPARADILNVPDDYESIQAAVDAAEEGDVILVDNGVYYENISVETGGITIASQYSETDDEYDIERTVIDGDNSGSCIQVEAEGEVRIVGFTLTNGSGPRGGGVWVQDSECTIEDCWITGNSVTGGGGVYVSASDVTIERCRIFDNSVADHGGGVWAFESSLTMSYCLVTDNSAAEASGVSLWTCEDVIIENCTIAGNDDDDHGGLYLNTFSTASLFNSIFYGNEPRSITLELANQLTVYYSDVEDGEEGVELGNDDALNWEEGNIDEDPLFVAPDEGDYHLTAESPCIDAGHPDFPEDPDGTRADMGALPLHQGEYMNVPDEYETIQAAINAAVDGDIVLVQPGVYWERIDFRGKDIIVASLVYTTGNEMYIRETSIQAQDNGSLVTFSNGESADAKLIGFTIRRGFAPYGGGIYCEGSSPTLEFLKVWQNRADPANRGGYGGGIYISGGRPSLTNVQIHQNSANYGAGMMVRDDAQVTLTDCWLGSNTAGDGEDVIGRGGGALILSSELEMNGGFITGNETLLGSGGGLYGADALLKLENVNFGGNEAIGEGAQGAALSLQNGTSAYINRCEFSLNSSDNSASIVTMYNDAHVSFTNCTMYDNSSENGSDIYLWTGCTGILVNCILWDNNEDLVSFGVGTECEFTVAYSDVEGGEDAIDTRGSVSLNWEEGNIDEDPSFEPGPPFISDDSPCIDAGTDYFEWEREVIVNLYEDDYAGNAPDMGFYEYDFVSVEDDPITAPQTFKLVNIYPNPFNSSLRIDYNLPVMSDVNVSLFDLNGRMVYNLTYSAQPAGRHTTVIDGADLSSGVYWVRVEDGVAHMTQKVVLMK